MTTVQSDFFPGADLGQADRKLCVSFDGIRFEITDPPPAWRAPLNNRLVCLRCDDEVDVFAPNAAHSIPLGRCGCNAAFLQPATLEDSGLLELRFPLSTADKALGARFRSQLSRLGAPGSSEREAK